MNKGEYNLKFNHSKYKSEVVGAMRIPKGVRGATGKPPEKPLGAMNKTLA